MVDCLAMVVGRRDGTMKSGSISHVAHYYFPEIPPSKNFEKNFFLQERAGLFFGAESIFFSRGGGSGIANDKKKSTVNQRELKKFLLEKINQPDNILEIEKVNRYMQFVELIAKLKQDIKKQGVTIVVENGSQSYIKTHPAIAEISKLNTSMLAIERTWNFKVDYIEDINDDDLI